jgi:hypothetical protein
VETASSSSLNREHTKNCHIEKPSLSSSLRNRPWCVPFIGLAHLITT